MIAGRRAPRWPAPLRSSLAQAARSVPHCESRACYRAWAGCCPNCGSGAIVALPELTASVLTRVAELEALGPEWTQLAGAHCEPMQSHAWQMAAVRHLHAGARLRVIVIHAGTRLIAAAPLVEVRRRGITWLELPGAASLHEPASLLADGPDALTALCRAISAQRAPVVLRRLDANGPTHAALAALSVADSPSRVRAAAVACAWKPAVPGRTSCAACRAAAAIRCNASAACSSNTAPCRWNAWCRNRIPCRMHCAPLSKSKRAAGKAPRAARC